MKERVEEYSFSQEFDISNVIGVDPGTRNIGIAIFDSNKKLRLFKINLQRIENSVNRMKSIQDIFQELFPEIDNKYTVIIEGASYNKSYGQVELAEGRASIALWFTSKGADVKIIPPKRVRKLAWGNGKIKNPYNDLPDDVAAALGCAISGSHLK